MSNFRNLALALFAAPLFGCSQPPAPNAPPTSTAAASAATEAPQTMIGRQVAKAIGKARKELASSNISISDGIDINVNGHKVRRPQGSPKAEISPAGDLLIEGMPVAVTPAQRAELLQYRTHVIAIAEAGMAVGVKGADIAGEALSGVAGAIFSGDEGGKAFAQRMEAKGALIEAEAVKICAQLPPLLASQQRLAGSLPAFKPYATMTQADIDDCGSNNRSGNTTVRDRQRDEIRDEIRDSVRSAIDSGRPAVDRGVGATAATLIAAVKTQRIQEIRRQVEAGVDINARVRGDGTAMIRAAADGNLAIVDELIRLGADVNKSSRGDGNPLIAAAKAGHLDIVKRLVTAGADIDAVVSDDETALINAARSGHLGVVTYLVQHGADVNQGVFADYGRWRSPLNQANDAGVRQYLQGKGAHAGRDP